MDAYSERHLEERKEAYENRFYSWNLWVERHLGKVVGKGWGVRNWFGSSEEGEWTKVGHGKFYGILRFLTFLSAIIGIWLLTNTNNLVLGILAWVMSVTIYAVYAVNNINPKIAIEWVAPYYKEAKPYKIIILFIFGWVILYLLLPQILHPGMISIQSATAPEISPTSPLPLFINLFLELYTILINSPIIETFLFGAILTTSLTRYFGIIPGLGMGVLIRGFYHIAVLHASEIGIIMAILMGLILYSSILKWKNSGPAVVGHSLTNTLALMLNSLLG